MTAAAATAPTADEKSIRPFHFHATDEALAELRRRIAATQWPEQETVTDSSQGVPLATMRKLARYWATDYDWRKAEAKLNALPHFVTNIDGLDIPRAPPPPRGGTSCTSSPNRTGTARFAASSPGWSQGGLRHEHRLGEIVFDRVAIIVR